jgi:hypothetical protein
VEPYGGRLPLGREKMNIAIPRPIIARTTRQLLGPWIVVLVPICSTSVVAQDATAPLSINAAPPSSVANQTEDSGADFVRPQNLFQLMYQFQTAPGSGAEKGTKNEVTTDKANIRVDRRIDFAPQWSLALRADLPILAKNPVSSGNPDGDYLYGVGDADIQAAFVNNFNERWGAGFGARLVAPTGGSTFGSGKWQIVPGGAVRYSLPELGPGSYLEPLVRYDLSVAGDSARRNISNVQFAPTLNLGLPNRWFVTMYPSADIRVNFGDPVVGQTGRLFLPFDARIGRKLSDNLVMSVEIGVPIIKDYPVYNFKTQVRLNLTY